MSIFIGQISSSVLHGRVSDISDGTMSTTVGKVEEQVSDVNKPQQNGHEHNKNEELQLEDINDNNNDEVIFSDIFS